MVCAFGVAKKSFCKPRSQKFTLIFTCRSFGDYSFGFFFDPKFYLGEYFENIFVLSFVIHFRHI